MKFLKSLLVALYFVSTSASAQSVFPTNDPKDYAVKVGNRIIEIVESKVPNLEKQNTLIDLFRTNSDTDYMAKFVMGRFFRQASKEQKSKYLELYRDYVIYSYIPRFREYEGEKQQVNQSVSQGSNEFIVKTTITSPKSKTGKINVDYRLLKSGNSFKIIDVIGEGVSLLTTQRSDFAAPLSQKGIDFFLIRLEDKVAKLKSTKWENRKKK